MRHGGMEAPLLSGGGARAPANGSAAHYAGAQLRGEFQAKFDLLDAQLRRCLVLEPRLETVESAIALSVQSGGATGVAVRDGFEKRIEALEAVVASTAAAPAIRSLQHSSSAARAPSCVSALNVPSQHAERAIPGVKEHLRPLELALEQARHKMEILEAEVRTEVDRWDDATHQQLSAGATLQESVEELGARIEACEAVGTQQETHSTRLDSYDGQLQSLHKRTRMLLKVLLDHADCEMRETLEASHVREIFNSRMDVLEASTGTSPGIRPRKSNTSVSSMAGARNRSSSNASRTLSFADEVSLTPRPLRRHHDSFVATTPTSKLGHWSSIE